MCFGPKHRSGCALHVPTSGAKKRRNRDLSSKAHHTLGTSQESWLFALLQSGAGIPRVEGMFCELRRTPFWRSSEKLDKAKFAFFTLLRSSATEHPPPPGPLCALLSLSDRRLGLYPHRLLGVLCGGF